MKKPVHVPTAIITQENTQKRRKPTLFNPIGFNETCGVNARETLDPLFRTDAFKRAHFRSAELSGLECAEMLKITWIQHSKKKKEVYFVFPHTYNYLNNIFNSMLQCVYNLNFTSK